MRKAAIKAATGGEAMVVRPEPIHVTIQENRDGLRIVLKNRRRWWRQVLAIIPVLWTVPFLLGLGIAVVGAYAATYAASASGNLRSEDHLPLIVLLGLFFAFYLLLLLLLVRSAWWGFEAQMLCTEVIAIDAAQWQITHDYGFWKVTKRYAAANVRDLRASPRFGPELFKQPVASLFRRPGRLIFRRGRWSQYEFAYSATEAETRHALAAIYQVYPQYRPTTAPTAKVEAPTSTRRRGSVTRELGTTRLILPVHRRLQVIVELVQHFLFSVVSVGFCIFLAIENTSVWPIVVLVGALGSYFLVWSVRELYWMFRGVEVVEISSAGLRLRPEHLLASQPREFESAYVASLRCSPRQGHPMYSLARWRKPGDYGTLAFNYGAATYRFGEGLDPDEAEELVQLFLAQFPRYGRDGLIGPHAE